MLKIVSHKQQLQAKFRKNSIFSHLLLISNCFSKNISRKFLSKTGQTNINLWKVFYKLILNFILQRKMDDFETITGKVNNAEKPYPPPSRDGSVLGNWKENGNDNSPSPKHPGRKLKVYTI